MAAVLPFPNQSVRALIHTTIKLWAAGKWSRQQMMSQVSDTMGSYGCSKLAINNYTVRVDTPVITNIGKFPVVTIEAKGVTNGSTCPVCRSKEYGYLAGENVITAMCLDCGCIYRFKPRKEDLQ